MTTLPPPVAEKCAKAIGQLASPHEGQVMAGARGLLRILEGAGLDITDLSDHITAPPREIVKYIHKPQDPPRAGPRDYGDWRQTWAGCDPRRQHKARVDLLTSDQTGFLTDWEFTFTRSLSRQLAEGRPLSPKQITILGDIYARWTEARG
ncbi:hypothetical protein [Methylobacterium sp.]|jgi:hypothetical protein|uniref:hypothetical protein n=1 Tax=Methylobacterium sp. TaxID=409 RepID=UPI000C3FB72B|nr:hypothetical protein [Methylobacterium sp.]MBP28110.1 hypothetical protein [Methylobacterium sp.]